MLVRRRPCLPEDRYLDFGNNYGFHFPRTLIGEAKGHSNFDIWFLCHLQSRNSCYQCSLTQRPLKSRDHVIILVGFCLIMWPVWYGPHYSSLGNLPFRRQDLFEDNFYLESFWRNSPLQMCFHISFHSFWNKAHILWSKHNTRDIKICLNHTIIIFCAIISCITPWTIWIIIGISAIIIVIFLSETIYFMGNHWSHSYVKNAP